MASNKNWTWWSLVTAGAVVDVPSLLLGRRLWSNVDAVHARHFYLCCDAGVRKVSE
jgi:hypothetical protein